MAALDVHKKVVRAPHALGPSVIVMWRRDARTGRLVRVHQEAPPPPPVDVAAPAPDPESKSHPSPPAVSPAAHALVSLAASVEPLSAAPQRHAPELAHTTCSATMSAAPPGPASTTAAPPGAPSLPAPWPHPASSSAAGPEWHGRPSPAMYSGAFIVPVCARTGLVLVLWNRWKGLWDLPGGKNDRPYLGCWRDGLGECAGDVAVREAGEEFGPALAAQASVLSGRAVPDACLRGVTAVFRLLVSDIKLDSFVDNSEMVCAGWMTQADALRGYGSVATLRGVLDCQCTRSIVPEAVEACVTARLLDARTVAAASHHIVP